MPDERPYRPQSRDRFGGDRTPSRGFGDRPAPRGGDRFSGERSGPRPGGFTPRPSGSPRPPFAARPTFGAPAEGSSSVRLRDGDREVEVHGPAVFCRQLLDDLPALMARLRGEGRPAATSIALPAPTAPRAAREFVAIVDMVDAEIEPPLDDEFEAAADTEREVEDIPVAPPLQVASARKRPGQRATGRPTSRREPASGATTIEELVHGAIRAARKPIGIAEIRQRLPEDISGQAVRRLLERDPAVINAGGKPATYRLR